MQDLSDFLKTKQQDLLILKENDTGRPINNVWEDANAFCSYLEYRESLIPFIIKLFRIYGRAEVLGLKSWLKDLEGVKGKEISGLIIWKLKENEKIRLRPTG